MTIDGGGEPRAVAVGVVTVGQHDGGDAGGAGVARRRERRWSAPPLKKPGDSMAFTGISLETRDNVRLDSSSIGRLA